MVRSSEIKLHNRETTVEAIGGARTPRRLYVPLPPIPNMEDYSGSDRAVTTRRQPQQIVGIVDIQQLLANLDTMSTLVRDTLVSRTEPTLEQSYEYWTSW